MGYYTRYKLSYKSKEELNLIDSLSPYIGKDLLLGFLSEEIKWYEHEHDMKKLSKMNPEVVFSLYGIGENYEDKWVKYFKNGKMQLSFAKMSFEEFDESKLKDIK